MLKTFEVDSVNLEDVLNEIGEDNIMYILPKISDVMHFQSYIIVCKKKE